MTIEGQQYSLWWGADPKLSPDGETIAVLLDSGEELLLLATISIDEQTQQIIGFVDRGEVFWIGNDTLVIPQRPRPSGWIESPDSTVPVTIIDISTSEQHLNPYPTNVMPKNWANPLGTGSVGLFSTLGELYLYDYPSGETFDAFAWVESQHWLFPDAYYFDRYWSVTQDLTGKFDIVLKDKEVPNLLDFATDLSFEQVTNSDLIQYSSIAQRWILPDDIDLNFLTWLPSRNALVVDLYPLQNPRFNEPEVYSLGLLDFETNTIYDYCIERSLNASLIYVSLDSRFLAWSELIDYDDQSKGNLVTVLDVETGYIALLNGFIFEGWSLIE